MKKILLTIVTSIAILGFSATSFAYTLTSKDNTLITALTQKIEQVISDRGEKTREPLVKAIQDLAKKYSKQPRVETILNKVADNIDTSFVNVLENILGGIGANLDYKIELRLIDPNTKDNTKYWNQKLVKINKKTNEEIVIIPNIKEILPELKDKQLALKDFTYPENSNFIFFLAVLMETGNPGGILYSFDIKNKQFKKMNINNISHNFFHVYISPDNTKFVSIPNNQGNNGLDQILYICYLREDICIEKISLDGNKTFNAGIHVMNTFYKIEWINNKRIKYSIFDQSKKQIHADKQDLDNIIIDTLYYDL